jgi:hypothetical protein
MDGLGEHFTTPADTSDYNAMLGHTMACIWERTRNTVYKPLPTTMFFVHSHNPIVTCCFVRLA